MPGHFLRSNPALAGLPTSAAETDCTLAEVLLRDGHVAEAERLLTGILRDAPSHNRTLQILGRLAFDAGRAADALGYFGRAAVEDPRAASCAGVTCQALGLVSEAETWHRSAAVRAPTGTLF